ncbi:integumentary mucin C.1-like [Mytilus californianus]|uniref:integumentary mucin C.1-like n=1 Tax=Mytilus californianus TaxID=6549 RepID=UPI0022451AD7|nr:integumentary mucin C.1-like [Mytilus californianus]
MSVHFWWENPVGTWRLKVGSYKGYSIVTLVSWSLTFYGTSHNPITQERTTVPTTQSKNTSDRKYVWTATNSASLPTSFTEPTSTSKAAQLVTVTTSDKLSTETATILEWTTLSTQPTTSSRGSDLSFLEKRTTVPTTQSKNTSNRKYVSTTTNSASIPTSFTEPTSTSKAANFLTATTSDKLITETATISDWTTLSTQPTTSARGNDLSFLTSDNKPVIIGGFVAGILLLGAVLLFIRWKMNVGRKKAVDSTTPSTAPAVFTA